MSYRTLLVSVVAAALAGYGTWRWREHLVLSRPLLPIIFDHHDHGAVRCVTCHHNFVDDTGRDACYFCHKIRPALAASIERDFHVFCRDCHQALRAAGHESGPLRACRGCHAAGPDAVSGSSVAR